MMKKTTPSCLVISLVLSACGSLPSMPTITQAIPSAAYTPVVIQTQLPPADLTRTALQANIRQATQTGAYYATRLAMTPSRTPRPTSTVTATPIPSPTLDPVIFRSWSVFSSEAAGIRFEYPTYYSVSPFSDYGCAPEVSYEDGLLSLDLGERVWVSGKAYDAATTTLNSIGESKVATYKADPDTQLMGTSWGWVAQERAFTIEYHFGGLGRYGIETYFTHSGILYQAAFAAGVTCGMTAVDVAGVFGLDDFDAYFHMLRTWEFLDS